MRLNARLRIWERWQAAAGGWQGWSVCPMLLAPGADEITLDASAPSAAADLAAKLATTIGHVAGGSAIIIDLEPVLGVYVAARLNEQRLANVVVVMPRWPYAQAVLPVDRVLGGLVSQATRLAPGDLPNVAFVLDAERSRAVPKRSRRDARADNRYRLSVADLPNLATLRARGIRTVIKLAPV